MEWDRGQDGRQPLKQWYAGAGFFFLFGRMAAPELEPRDNSRLMSRFGRERDETGHGPTSRSDSSGPRQPQGAPITTRVSRIAGYELNPI